MIEKIRTPKEILEEMLVKDFRIDKKTLTNGYWGDLLLGDVLSELSSYYKSQALLTQLTKEE